MEAVDEHPERRREYSGAGSTLGVAVLIIAAVAVAIWWFELRGSDGASLDNAIGLVGAGDDAGHPGALVNQLAPDFELPAADGAMVRLSDYRGRWVVVAFWASWCLPCGPNAVELQRLHDGADSQVVVLGVNQQDTRQEVLRFVGDYSLTYPIAIDANGEVSASFNVGLELPVLLLVDPDGVVRRAASDLDEQLLEEASQDQERTE